MVWKPFNYRPGPITIVYEELLVGSSAVGTLLSETTMKNAVDFQASNADRQFSKYVGTAKNRLRNFQGNRWLTTESDVPYSGGTTHFLSQIAGVGDEVALGRMWVSYYVWFKTQRTTVG